MRLTAAGGRFSLSEGAIAAVAEDLDGVADVDEAVRLGHLVRPAFDLRAVHLDREAAVAAHEMVVVPGGAPPEQRLAAVGAQHVDAADLGERLQGAVDGRQADALAALAQLVVKVLGGPEFLGVVEQVDDGAALTGRADPHERFAGGGHCDRPSWA
ncbi:hypothetical protein NJ76_02010 [Rhodococcus sp. IITR03]|nr:hypothetical protein NJ76_02010 [Rhodococcus sp. IITR03]